MQLNSEKSICTKKEGCLPSCAPLANPYVPYQQTATERYTADVALARGTVFEGLDLPLMGIVNENKDKMTAMDELQALGFCVNELALYLDTHPDDEEAVAIFNTYAELYDAAVNQFQKNGKDFTQLMSGQSGKYTWLSDPWPWDYKQEG